MTHPYEDNAGQHGGERPLPKDPAQRERVLAARAGMASYDEFQTVNKSVRRVDAMKLALGRGTFTDDVVPDGALHIKMLWSPHAHARVVRVDTSRAEALPGVHLVLHHGNTPRVSYTTAGQGFPEPSPYDNFMFPKKVRFVGDRVCAVAADDERIAAQALELIDVEYEVLPAVLDMEDAMKPGAPVIHDEDDATGIFDATKNLSSHLEAYVGEVAQGFADADVVVERTYEMPFQQHCPAENHVAITSIDEDNRLLVRVATQVPFHSRRTLARVLDIPVARIRVVKPRIGGGFGGKQEILMEDLPALVSLRTGRPARWAYTRQEQFFSARTRHPMRVTMKMGAKRDGTLTAIAMHALSNGGAYGAHGLTVASCVGGKPLPLYRAPHYEFLADIVYTNLPVAGAFRGYGAPQGFFPVERHMDLLADELGMDPLALRELNMIGEGDDDPLSVALGEGGEGFPRTIYSCGLPQAIAQGKEAIGWERRGTFNNGGPVKRGMGVALLMQASSIPGVDMAASFLKLNDDGSFNLLVGATDIGTGSDTVLSQIAAEVLDVPMSKVVIYSSDTDLTPFDTGAYASSTTFLSGGAVKKAAEDVRAQIVQAASEMLEVPATELTVRGGAVHAPGGRSVSYGEVCLSTFYQMNQRQIMGHASHMTLDSPPPFSAHFCEVEVDVETGGVRVLNYVAAIDCGVAINPKAAEGQTEGGAGMMMGYALSEEYRFDEAGRLVNGSLGGYKPFGALDMPRFKTILIPTYEPTGPFGAKSVSEIPSDGPGPAITSAIFDATGIFFDTIPVTPERMRAAWLARAADEGANQ